MEEFHGNHHVFWPYANAGFSANRNGDWATAAHLYLRAYRNTGMVLAPREDSVVKSMLFGLSADLTETSKIHAYALKLDDLTPLPGVGPATNDVLDTAMNYQRSLAAYNWARQTGHWGNFKDAERAFLYSLHLEETRDWPERDKLTASRHYELARLYHAWGKSELSIQHYRRALEINQQMVKEMDPVGFANVLDEFSNYLDEAGQTNEASQIKMQSIELRKNNPNKVAKFNPEPYPKRIHQ